MLKAETKGYPRASNSLGGAGTTPPLLKPVCGFGGGLQKWKIEVEGERTRGGWLD